ncbi:MAG TPA: flippase-like domain-containing protein [Nitrospirae bacterium]|nr:flippase-like domain-containing protein [Nitrospirota bacterium]
MKSKLSAILKISVSGILLYFISKQIEWSQVVTSVKNGYPSQLIIGVLLGCGFNIVKFIKWHYLIKTEGHDYSFVDGAKSYMIGNCLGMVTPLRAGDLGRALYFDNNERPRIMGLTIIDRFIELVAVLILSIAGCFVLLNRGVGFMVVVLAAAGLAFLYTAGILHSVLKRIMPVGRVGEKIMKLIDVLRMFRVKTVSVVLLLSVVTFVLCILQFYYLITAFEETTRLSAFLVTPLITLSSILPVSLMGLGVREGISIVLFSKFGVSAAAALSAAFLFFLINNLSISVIGIFFLSKIKIKNKNTDLNCGIYGDRGDAGSIK